MLTLKISDFRPAHKNKVILSRAQKQVNFGPQTKNKSIYIAHTKPSQVRPQHWSQVNFDPRSNNKSMFQPPRHENQVNFDPDSKPSHFRPIHKTKPILSPTLKSSQLRSPTLKSRLFRTRTRQPSQFRFQH